MYKIATFSLTKSLKILIIAALLSMFSMIFLGSKHASAISSQFPRGTSTGDEWVLLSQYQCPGHCLQTPKADIRIFYNDAQLDTDGVGANDSLSVNVESLCRYNGTPDGNAVLTGGTSKPGWPGITCTGLNTNTGNAISSFSITRGNLSCGDPQYPGWCYTDLNVSLSPNPGNQPIVGVYVYATSLKGNVKITAQEDQFPGNNYTNTDCYTGAGGTCTPSGGPPRNNPAVNNVIALWNNFNNNGPDTHSNWSMTFAPDCTVTATKQVYLRWYDADDGGNTNNGTQSGQISFDLYDQTSGTFVFNNKTNLGGNDSYRDAAFTVTPGHKYKWTWNNVSATNGIQIWLPYSEINTIVDCTQKPKDAAVCSASPASITVAPNTPVNISIVATNKGTSTWDKTYYMKRVGPNVVNLQNVSGTVGPGKTFPFTDTVTSPGAGSTKTVTYKMYNDSGPFGTSCVMTITSKKTSCTPITCPGGGANLDVSCSSIEVSGAVASGTVNGAKIKRIPAVIVIENANNPSESYSYLVKGGIPQGGGTKIDTFNVPGINYKMWPHNVYNIRLFFEGVGTPPPNSPSAYQPLTYPDDGSWNPTDNTNNGGYWYPPTQMDDENQQVRDCLDASCGSYSAPDSEPGQRGNYRYEMDMTNRTTVGFGDNDPNGYHFDAGVDGGLTGVAGTTASPDPFGPGNPIPVNVNFTAVANSKGNYWIVLKFQGNTLTLPSLPSGECPHQPQTPNTRPFFQVSGADLAAGGGFSKVSDVPTCTLGDPGYISPATGAGYGLWSGGVRAYGNSAGRGSSAQFGVLSLGYNIGSPGGPTGLYSKSSAVFADRNQPGVGGMGGLLNAAGVNVSGWHCVNDFFTKTRKTNPAPATLAPGNINVDSLASSALPRSDSGQYIVSGDVTLVAGGCTAAGTIPEGKQVTLYVEGNVTIASNICYADTWQPFDRLDVPYFSLIVKGDITVQAGVTRLDGLYVAQPSNRSDGIFSTCDGFCNKQLTVNGAVIVQSIQLKREHGTVGPLESDPNGIGDNEPAEIFNYTPAMTLGQPNFSSNYTSLESIFSLPPVF